jgi:tellurite resistance protein
MQLAEVRHPIAPVRKLPAGAMTIRRDLLMIQQSTPTEQISAQDSSTQEAFVALLIASARADGSVSAHEANRIEHVVAGMKLFRGHSNERLQKVFATAAERIKEHGVPSVVQAAAAIVPKELGATTFAVAIDLMLSDGRLSPKEEGFAEELRTLLNVERDAAGRIVDVLLIKNAG